MSFTGLPLDEELSRAAYLKEFYESYGEGANAKALYEVQPMLWTRFAAAYPRQAFLIDSLWRIYSDIYSAILDFAKVLTRVDPEGDWQKIGAGFTPCPDGFAFFSNPEVEEEEHVSLLQLSWALNNSRHGRLDYLLRECARDLLAAAKSEDRALIIRELLDSEGSTADALRACQLRRNVGFWAARKSIVSRDRILSDSLGRFEKALEVVNEPKQRRLTYVADPDETTVHDVDFEYGNGSVIEQRTAGRAHFADSPTRSRSPPPAHRRNEFSVPYRSQSRDSVRSSIHPGSSVTTWAPEVPESKFSVSVRVLSASSQDWVESLADYDTACDAGNFVSSSFVEDHLDMTDAIEVDPDAESTRIVDIGGNTTFRPRGRIKLTWVGRNLHKGRKGKRSETFTGWFYVAPRPPMGQTVEPFQILLGKDFIDENEIFTYRGFRLFRLKKQPSPQDSLELKRREREREQLEDERRIERQASDAVSVMTGTSGTTSSVMGGACSPRSSGQSLHTSITTNGIGVSVPATP
jgi:hypothetical protein